jgi:hypothetical protein
VAQDAGTAQAYQAFMERHSDSELAGVARQRVAQLTEQAAWQQATRSNTAAAYRDYLAKYPNGSWSQDARIRMESKSLAQAPQGAMAVTPAVATPAIAPDRPGPEASPPPAPAAQPNFTVQLGAFSSGANAREAWRQLSFRFQSQLGGLTPAIVPVTGSRLTSRANPPRAGSAGSSNSIPRVVCRCRKRRPAVIT